MMKKIALSLAAALISTLALPLAAQSQGNGGCATVLVGSEQKNKGSFDSTFSATEVVDIDFSILFTPGGAKRFTTGVHQVELRVYTPNGYLYQSMAIPVSSDTLRKGKPAGLSGYPQAMPTQILSDVTYGNIQHQRAMLRLPVAGTPILTNSLYGVWRAQAYVDGETVPCSGAAKFTITQ